MNIKEIVPGLVYGEGDASDPEFDLPSGLFTFDGSVSPSDVRDRDDFVTRLAILIKMRSQPVFVENRVIGALLARQLLHMNGEDAAARAGLASADASLLALPVPSKLPSKHLLYIIGEPGIGKSTLVGALTSAVESTTAKNGIPYTVWSSTPLVAEIGAYRESFSGTDALAMDAQPKVCDWIEQTPYSLLLGEGDRLSTASFFEAVQRMDINLHVACLHADPAIASDRRNTRAFELNVPAQNRTWVAGRLTKVQNLAGSARWPVSLLDATKNPDALVDDLLQTGDPVAMALKIGTVQ